MNRIVVATDGSAEARRAVQEGIELAARVEAEVTFVSVRDAVSTLRHDRHGRTEATAAGVTALDDALTEAAGRGVAAAAESADGDPRAEILRVAHLAQADLIVVGSSGSAGGGVNVSRDLPRRTDIPVLVVDPPNL